jgi:hypothetical protein
VAVLALSLASVASAAPAIPKAKPTMPQAKPAKPQAKPTKPPKARTTNEEIVAAAKASPLFKRSIAVAKLPRAGLGKVALDTGVAIDLADYVRSTGLKRRAELAPLFDAKLTKGVLARKPVVREQVIELEDRFVVDRKLTFELVDGACASPKPELADLCFVASAQQAATPELTSDIAKMRDALAQTTDVDIGQRTAADLLALDDDTLLGLVVNTGERTIHHVSIVPQKPIAAAAATNLAERPPISASATVAPAPAPTQFPTKYFLTGFTYGHGFDDSWEFTIAKKRAWHDRYYISIDVHLGLGFGVRAPFAVNVASVGTGDTRTAQISVDPIDVDENGNPAFQPVGLPASQYFGGKEFVLDSSAGLCVYASIPGPNLSECESVGIDLRRDLDPVIGDETQDLDTWWAKGEDTGLKLEYSVAGAYLDVGVQATTSHGRVGMHVSPRGDASVDASDLSFAGTDPVGVVVTRPAGSTNAGIRLDQPSYSFDATFTPKLKGHVDVDVGVWEKSWTIATVSLNSLKVTGRVDLQRHPTTVDHHDYDDLFGDAPDPNAPKRAKTLPKARPGSPAPRAR